MITCNKNMENNLNQFADLAKPIQEEASVKPRITLDQLVNLAIEQEASDIHFGENSRVALRVEGKIVFIENLESLSKKEAEEMIFKMIDSEDEKKRLERVREIDVSYTHTSGVSFRVNVFYQKGMLTASMRTISKHLPSVDELGIPEETKKLLAVKEGLILVVGPAGSGKSTSTQAMLEYINQNFVDHVITIENPIEYVFENKKSIFSQRELGKDTLTVTNALNSAMHEDPNVIMVSEINNLETLNNVLTAVETGHLVISAMSTKNAKQTLERLVAMYPPSQQAQAQERLADNITCILAQDLVNRIDQSGRIAIYELLIFSSSVRSIIKRGNLSQLKTAIQSGVKEGMLSMDTYAYQLADQGIISHDEVNKFIEKE
jgi:twitching motility protein PilT